MAGGGDSAGMIGKITLLTNTYIIDIYTVLTKDHRLSINQS